MNGMFDTATRSAPLIVLELIDILCLKLKFSQIIDMQSPTIYGPKI